MSAHSGRGEYHRSATRSASFKLGKKGTAGNPAPSWRPNLRRDGTYDPRPQRSVRKTRPETFRKLDPEIGSRVFVSGLPKDITNQDLEDLMSSTIGPVHEVYIVHQYLGIPLYRLSNAHSGPQRNPEAEVAENIRNICSTGCGMVHFQREKDAMEAWEQYHGKLLDNDSTVLRVQIVIDADETWLIPKDERESDSTTDANLISVKAGDMDHQMAIDENVPNPSHTVQPVLPASQIVHPKQQLPTPAAKAAQPVKVVSSKNFKTPSTGPVSTLSLVQRIGPSTSEAKARLGVPIVIGGHIITGINPVMNGPSTDVIRKKAAKPLGKPANVVIAPRGKLKRGPRRMNKIAARQAKIIPIDGISALQIDRSINNGATRASPITAQDLDAEMELYRKGGLMGLNGMGR